MKRSLALILALLLVAALFSGCSGTGDTPPTVSPDSSTSPSTGADNQEQENSPYKFAAGNFATDERGIATEKYNYELPFCTTDEVLTFWTTCWNPEYIPAEGFDSMPFPTELAAQTGVKVEYTIVSSDTMSTNYAVLLAADDLCDLMCHGASYYPGTVKEAVEEEYFINIYDYREYCPNYMYEAVYRDTEDKATYSDVFYEDDFVYSFWNLYDGKVVSMGPVIRLDWAEKLGMGRDDIRTWDDLYNLLVGMKSAGYSDAPFQLIGTIEINGANIFTGFDTIGFVNTSALQQPYQINGQVQMLHTNQNDLDLVSYLNKCWNAGVIDPDWAGTSTNNDYQLTKADKCGFFGTTASGINTLETNCNDPEAKFTTIHKLLKTTDSVLHVGEAASRKSYGETSISAKCENIPLAVTWCDFRYSEGGYELINYGVKDLAWEYDENGNVRLTDFVLHNPDGLNATWVQLLHAFNNLADCGLEDSNRKLHYEGGTRFIEFGEIWYDFAYDGAYEWPAGLNLSDEDQQEVNELAGDVVTYIAENFTAFVDNSKPLSEWDAYIAGLSSIGNDEIKAIYQNTLDAYYAA